MVMFASQFDGSLTHMLRAISAISSIGGCPSFLSRFDLAIQWHALHSVLSPRLSGRKGRGECRMQVPVPYEREIGPCGASKRIILAIAFPTTSLTYDSHFSPSPPIGRLPSLNPLGRRLHRSPRKNTDFHADEKIDFLGLVARRQLHPSRHQLSQTNSPYLGCPRQKIKPPESNPWSFSWLLARLHIIGAQKWKQPEPRICLVLDV
ncbi:hypothetical protein B0T22DRAFT_471283 [Podospora appendiculata]|uniref:Uncharacterized protein n=1 Tax=Podospora appendiculata TaxID=314037 RepID=A0AAE1C890_9PEZI|nr:hypothetical protein B0T22DRAFT_471283 [Podospora appendiculata]